MRRLVVAIAITLVGAFATAALANGRFPSSTNARFQPGSDQLILLPVTFGLLISSDDGGTFHWVCEDAIGYGGTYDPDYAIAPGGRIYATTFDGLRYSDDGGCSFQTLGDPVTAPAFVAEVEIAPDGRVWVSTATGGMPNDVYVSTDGTTFASTGLADADTWWRSLRIAPSRSERIYVAGIRLSTSGAPSEPRIEVSDDGGLSFGPLPLSDLAFGPSPDVFIEGVMPSNPDIVFARVRGARPPVGDDLYRSENGGATWQLVLSMSDTISAFTIRQNGDVIVGTVGLCEGDAATTQKGCVRISTDGGETFQAAASEPKMACVGERSDGDLFACGANWEPDMFALGRSADGMSWTKVTRFSELAGPLDCPQSTQQKQCEELVWPSLCVQLGICVDGADAGPTTDEDKKSDGLCSANVPVSEGLFAVALVALALLPLRRRRQQQR